MLRLLPLALLAFLALPSGAQAACGVPAAHAVYETPEVQVFPKQAKLIACYRPTGKQRVVGDVMGTDKGHFIYGLLGGRWLYQEDYATSGQSSDYRNDQLLDLRTGKQAEALAVGDGTRNEVVGLAGALVSAGDDGVVARFADGRKQRLESAPA